MSERIEVPLPSVELSGFDTGFSEEELNIQQMINRFAKEVMRPLGQELDKMPVNKAYEKGSPFWDFHEEFAKLGMSHEALADMPPEEALRIDNIVAQEMGFGDVGLTVSTGVGGLPSLVASQVGDPELIGMCEGKLGAWMITQPDRGGDGMIMDARQRHNGAQGNKGNLQAYFKGDDIIINGQSSAWVSNGPVAQVAVLDIVADYGDGFYDKHGNVFGTNLIVPLDLPGISKGKPLEKIGKRPLPQGETYFDNVKVPKRFAIATKEDYEMKSAMAWTKAGSHMGHMAVGLARAALEMTLNYVNERKQGGSVISDLQLTQYRLGGIGIKVEAMKAMARHVGYYSTMSPAPHPYFTASGKAFCCNEMANVLKECMSLFGGNGLTAEYPIEKLYRDSQSMQIEDGENNLLQMHYGFLLKELNAEKGWGA
jgi:alkylation response protein AidB-like acyl-CoA dehydrogenase